MALRKLIIFSIVGFQAQLVDGALGMSYGATSTTLLLTFGMAPAIVSATVHLSEIATTAASGASHLYFKNVDKEMLFKLILPGVGGAFAGAALLSSIPGDLIKPFISIFLLSLGIYIMYRFLFKMNKAVTVKPGRNKTIFLLPLGAAAGFFDAVGGGGWGPINTPVLLSQRSLTPRKIIGTVDTSEFFIAVSASLGFLVFLGWSQLNWALIGAFVIGGVIAAPIAAYLVRIVPAHLLGVLVGGFIILTNARTLLTTIHVSDEWSVIIHLAILAFWAGAIAVTVKKAGSGNQGAPKTA